MDSRLYYLRTTLSLMVVLYINFGVDGCSFAWPDACKDVVCLNGNKCSPDSSYWCRNRTGSICIPRGRCDKPADPCKTEKCSSKEQCVRIIDDCKNTGGCTFHAQCNEIERSGSCPRPDVVRSMETSCSNKCDNDATCEIGAKCCPGGFFGKVCVKVPFRWHGQ